MDKRILFVFLWAAILLGQTPTATVVGMVRDSSGAVVVGARVTARDEGTNIAHEAVTGDEGGYTIPLLTPGVYSVSAEAQNFRRTVARDHSASRPEGAYRPGAGTRSGHGPDRGHRRCGADRDGVGIGRDRDRQPESGGPSTQRQTVLFAGFPGAGHVSSGAELNQWFPRRIQRGGVERNLEQLHARRHHGQ